MKPDQAASLLELTPLFADLDRKGLESLAERAIFRTYQKGRVIFTQGEPGDSLFVLVEGLVKVGVSSETGDEMVLVTLRPPDTFGELAVVDGGDRSASAQAVELTMVLIITRGMLIEVLEQHRPVVDALLRSLGALLRRLTEQAGDLVFLDLHGRVAKLLLRMGEERGRPSEEGIVLDLGVTQRDLANMVGGSRQSVNQILHLFEGRGYLDLGRRSIVLKRPEDLQRRAGM